MKMGLYANINAKQKRIAAGSGEKMRFIMPFFNAWENTIRRWSGLTKENPAVVARAGQIVSSLRNQPNVVDQDGNPTTEFSYENKIVVPMSEGAITAISKIPVWGKGMAEARALVLRGYEEALKREKK